MTCDLEQIGTVPPIYAVRVYEPGRSLAARDPYFAACVAVVQPDGIPLVECFAPPPMSREKCHEVREAMGVAFRANGWTHYWRTHPGSTQRTLKRTLPVEDETCVPSP